MTKSSDLSKVQTSSRKDIIRTVAIRTGYTLESTKEILDLFLNEIVEELVKGNRIEFRHFGVFQPMVRKGGGMRYNPRTREPMGLAEPQKFAKFKPSKRLKDALNNDALPNTH